MGTKYSTMRQYLKRLKAEEVMGGKADGLPDSQFDKAELAKGIKIEKEHTNNPAVAKEITKDHLTEHDMYYEALPPMERMLEDIEAKAACTRFEACKIILRAAAKSGDFYKNVPGEIDAATKKWIDANPEKAQQYFTGEKLTRHPEIMAYLQQLKQINQPAKADVHQNIAKMQGELNTGVLQDGRTLDVVINSLTGDPTQDWKAVEQVASKKLITYVQHNTEFTPATFLNKLKAANGNLSQVITPEDII